MAERCKKASPTIALSTSTWPPIFFAKSQGLVQPWPPVQVSSFSVKNLHAFLPFRPQGFFWEVVVCIPKKTQEHLQIGIHTNYLGYLHVFFGK